MIVSANPRVLVLDSETGVHTADVMDFWRPNYLSTALVDGQYSTKVYLRCVRSASQDFQMHHCMMFLIICDMRTHCAQPVPNFRNNAPSSCCLVLISGPVDSFIAIRAFVNLQNAMVFPLVPLAVGPAASRTNIGEPALGTNKNE